LPIVHNVDQRRILFYKKLVSQQCFTRGTRKNLSFWNFLNRKQV